MSHPQDPKFPQYTARPPVENPKPAPGPPPPFPSMRPVESVPHGGASTLATVALVLGLVGAVLAAIPLAIVALVRISDLNQTGRWKAIVGLVASVAWIPVVPTPNHPEYPAAHGAVSTAYAETLRHFFGTKKVTITLSSIFTGTTHTFHSTDEIIKEIIDARVYGGMHYRTSGVHGSVMGRKVANWIDKHYFQPVAQ